MDATHQPVLRGNWSLAELLAAAGVEPLSTPPVAGLRVSSLTADSRLVAAGSCFVAVRGDKFDGHAFVGAAGRAGAAAILVDSTIEGVTGAQVIRVPDTRAALARLAVTWSGLNDLSAAATHAGSADGRLSLVGVTGTNGKSTVAWLLRSIFQAAGRRAAMLGTVEYDLVDRRTPAALTTPGSIELALLLSQAVSAGATHAVMEVSSHALEQHRCDGLPFAAAVFTNLSGDHLDYHGDMERYFAAKRRLFALPGSRPVAVVNGDDPYGRRLREELSGDVISYGLAGQDGSSVFEVSAVVNALGREKSELILRGQTFEQPLVLPLVGEHNIYNALAAAATAEALGVSPCDIVEGLARVSGVPGRLQRVEPDGWPFGVLVDYAHTDAALDNVLRALRPLTPRRLICVFGCGGNRDAGKRPRMAAAVGRLADVAVVTSDNPRNEDPDAIIAQMLPGFGDHPACQIEVCADRRRAISRAIALAGAGDTVLIAGKGHERTQEIAGRYYPFDDVDVARGCLIDARIREAVA